MPTPALQRILLALPLAYYPESGFWPRDSGLLTLALRRLGYDARLVTLRGKEGHPLADEPLICGTLAEWENPDWWRQWKPDAILLTGWSAPRYDRVRKACLAATPHVIEKLDTSGVRSPRVWYRQALLQSFGGSLDAGSNRINAAFRAALFHHAVWLFPRLMDIPMAKTMAQIPVLGAESPLAAARIQRHLRLYQAEGPRIVVLPHPVNTEHLAHDNKPKEKRVVSVGRWAAYQKDLPFVLRLMRLFLRHHPDWELDLVGSGILKSSLARYVPEPELRHRIRLHSVLDHAQLAEVYNRARIYLMASRWESFCIAAAEALCCGCSVVGSPDIPTSGYFSSAQSGTVPSLRNIAHFNDALDAEVLLWDQGLRNPTAISAHWIQTVGAEAVARQAAAIFTSLPLNARNRDYKTGPAATS